MHRVAVNVIITALSLARICGMCAAKYARRAAPSRFFEDTNVTISRAKRAFR